MIETEINVAVFRQKDTTTLLFIPLWEEKLYKIFHASHHHGSCKVKEQMLYGKKSQARVIMSEDDSLLVLGLRAGFPAQRLHCKNGIIQSDGGEYLDVVVGDVEEMSKYQN